MDDGAFGPCTPSFSPWKKKGEKKTPNGAPPPAPVLAQTEKELYLVEEQRTEHRTLPGLQGAPEDRMFTTQVCCLVPKEDFFASDLRGSRRVLPWGID